MRTKILIVALLAVVGISFVGIGVYDRLSPSPAYADPGPANPYVPMDYDNYGAQYIRGFGYEFYVHKESDNSFVVEANMFDAKTPRMGNRRVIALVLAKGLDAVRKRHKIICVVPFTTTDYDVSGLTAGGKTEPVALTTAVIVLVE